MAISAFWYGPALVGQYSNVAARRIDWVTDTIKVLLATSTYTPAQDTHDFLDDITGQVTGTGYTAGGVTLGSKSVTYDAATNRTSLLAANSQWVGATFTTRYAVVYKDTTVAATSPVLGYVDFGADQTVNSGNFTIEWNATEGVLKHVAA